MGGSARGNLSLFPRIILAPSAFWKMGQSGSQGDSEQSMVGWGGVGWVSCTWPPIGASADPAKAGPTLAEAVRKAASLGTCALGVSHNSQLQNGSCRLICGSCPSLKDRRLPSWPVLSPQCLGSCSGQRYLPGLLGVFMPDPGRTVEAGSSCALKSFS